GWLSPPLWPRRQDVAPSAYRRCTNYCCPAFWECTRDDGRWHAAPLPLFSAHQTHSFCGKRLPTDVPGMNLSRTLLRFVCPMLLSKDHGVLLIRRRTRPSAITSGLPTGSISRRWQV